jgi:hypothetical protein
MNNHTRNTLSGEGKTKVLDLSGKKGKRWQPYQAYSRLYYEKKLRQCIWDSYIEYIAELPHGNKPDSTFKYRNRELRVLLENETSEVKAEVEALCERSVSVKEQAELDKLMDDNLNEEDVKKLLRKRSASKHLSKDDIDLQAYRKIQALPSSMMTILDEVLRQCGFIGTLLVGGPNPDVPDRVMSMIFHTGKTAMGQNFADVYPDLKTSMTSSFNTFAHKCLSKLLFVAPCKKHTDRAL